MRILLIFVHVFLCRPGTDRSNATCDRLYSTSAIKLSGDLHINLLAGSFAAGNAITILSAKSISGSFSNIYPATPGEGLLWDTSTLYSTGVLRVVADDGDGINRKETSTPTVRGTNGAIVIEGVEGITTASISTAGGEFLSTFELQGNTCLPLRRGLYVVKLDTTIHKVVVR